MHLTNIRNLALGTCGAVALVASSAAFAQADRVQAIRDSMIIDVALVLGTVEQGTGEGTLWVRGERPASTVLARFTVKPVQVAALDTTPVAAGAVDPSTLYWRAFPGGVISGMRSGQLDLVRAPRYFCRAGAGGTTPSCLIDKDSDGRFDHQADGVPERGAKSWHLTLIKAPRPIAQPLGYRILSDDQRPEITIELDNCDRDHDRPRFSARSVDDRAAPLVRSSFAWMRQDSTLSTCRRSRQIDAVPAGAAPPPPNGFVAQLGPYAFTIGEKKNPRFALAGPVDPQALYRIEGNALVELSAGFTPGQARLVAMKQFPYPMMMTDEGSKIATGVVAKGSVIASIPFHHAYRGRLTQDVTISTLFGKRSVAAGTMVYGFPAKSTISSTRNGIPEMSSEGDEDYRRINLELTWCAPLRREPGPKDKPDPVGRNGWSGTCLPHSALGSHTILNDRQPAFGISGLSYGMATASNQGPPPIERNDDLGFDKALRLDYIFEGREGEFLSLTKQVFYGDELTSAQPEKIFAPEGAGAAIIAGTPVVIVATDAGELSVTSAGAGVVGSDPELQWDRQALFRRQIEKMGLHMAEEPAPVDVTPAP